MTPIRSMPCHVAHAWVTVFGETTMGTKTPRIFGILPLAFLQLVLLLGTGCGSNETGYALAIAAPNQVETDIEAAPLNSAHTLAVRYLAQFEATSLAPMLSVSTNDAYWLGLDTERVSVMLRGNTCSVPLDEPIRWNTETIPTPKWRHLAVSVTATNDVAIYQDGLATPATCAAGTSFVGGTLVLGRRAVVSGIQPQFNGLIDDIVLYDHALSSEEALELATGSAPMGASSALDFEQPGFLDRVAITKARDATSDQHQFARPNIVFDHLPFKDGEVWRVIQAWNNGQGSHRGQAAFSLDLSYIKPEDVVEHRNTAQSETQGREIVSVMTTTVDIAAGSNGPCASNYVRLHVGPDAFAIYHHLEGGVAPDSGSAVTMGSVIGKAGDSGLLDGSSCTVVPGGCCHRSTHDHLHFAVAAGIPRPYVFKRYEVSTDQGRSWQRVEYGFPYRNEWIRGIP